MTLLIPLQLRLTTLFKRGARAEEPLADAQLVSEEVAVNRMKRSRKCLPN
jgi:hypothetical protein